MADRAALEMPCAGNRTAGSNPAFSAGVNKAVSYQVIIAYGLLHSLVIRCPPWHVQATIRYPAGPLR